jgi:flagellar basal body-associated protein FliL
MAEENEQNQEGQQEEQNPGQSKTDAKKRETIISWSIMGSIILVFALSGFFLGKVLVETLQAEPIMAAQIAGMSQSGQSETTPDQEIVDGGKTWFYDLLPVVANLDEPGATRYIRTTLTLEIYDALDEDKGKELLKEKAPHMRNWLTIYLASLSLDDARGEKNLKRIQSHVLEEFNQMLFPNEKPQVSHILLKDFAIQ